MTTYLNLIQHDQGVEFDVTPKPAPASLMKPGDIYRATYRMPFTFNETVNMLNGLLDKMVDVRDPAGSSERMMVHLAPFLTSNPHHPTATVH